MKIKKGDEVEILRGKDKGKKGKVENVFTKENKVFISGVNLYKRHMKSKTQTKPSEIITIGKPLPVSNVMLVCPKCHTKTKVGYKMDGEKKNRMCKKCEAFI